MDEKTTGNRQQATGNRQSPMRLGSDIAERLLQFAVTVVGFAEGLPKNTTGRHVTSQVIRSATAGGSNYEEARAAESRNDFVHKAGIAAKEVRETAFWLALIHRSGWTKEDVAPAIREAGELASILAASARTARARAKEPSAPGTRPPR